MKLNFIFRKITYSWYYTAVPSSRAAGKFQFFMNDEVRWLPKDGILLDSYQKLHCHRKI